MPVSLRHEIDEAEGFLKQRDNLRFEIEDAEKDVRQWFKTHTALGEGSAQIRRQRGCE